MAMLTTARGMKWVERVYWVAIVLESPRQAGLPKNRVVGQKEI